MENCDVYLNISIFWKVNLNSNIIEVVHGVALKL